MGIKKPCRDHLGKKHPSVPDMCAAWGISDSTYAGRLERGWTVEQALTVPPHGQGPKVNPRTGRMLKDHLGQEFVSVGAMCRHWGISEKVYWSRKRICKWPLERILTEPVHDARDTGNAVKVTDHTGQEFPSISEMCRHWKIRLSTYRERRKRGWDVGRALTGKETRIETDAVPCTDHAGTHYPSKNAMCRAWGLTRYCYESRLDLGWSQERALTEPMTVNAKPCRDHAGREFPASTYMALYMGFPKYAFQGRDGDISRLIPAYAAKYWAGRACGRYAVKTCISFPWFLVRDAGRTVVIHFDRLLEEWHRTDFQPLPETNVKDPYLETVRLVSWPWYLCRIDDGLLVMDYWNVIRTHRDSNYGLSEPGGFRLRNGG